MNAAQTLAQVPLFRGMSPDYLDRLQRVSRERSYEAGSSILREGELGIAFFVIVSGNVDVLRGAGADQTVINKLGPGQSFGEMALLSELPRMATVRAVDSVKCIAMTRLDLLDALRDQPEIAIAMLKTMGELLRKAEARAEQASVR